MPFRYFVIGAGSIGRRHAENLNILGADIVHYGWRDIDMHDLLHKISACNGQAGVIVATSTNVRLPLIVQCAAAGAALYIEKPIAYRTSDVASIFNLPQAVLKRSVAGFMMRYHPMVQKLVSKPIADVFRASFEIGHDLAKWRRNWTFSDSYAADPEGGGVLLDLCHEIDLASLLCGAAPLTSVKSIQDPNFNGIDIATNLEFAAEDGRSYRVAMDYLAPSLIRRGTIIGLKEQIDYDFVNHSITYVSGNKLMTDYIVQERNQMFLDFMADFMALAEGRGTTNSIIPRLDKVKQVCNLIAQAWEMREFTGQLRMKLT